VDGSAEGRAAAVTSYGVVFAVWLRGKLELIKADSQAYRFCEAVLNLSNRCDRNENR
jgi:hypothetical protein